MDWTAGYASDVEYIAGFYKDQSPVFLNFVCVQNGFEPVPLDRPFTYCELGFGRGLTVNLLAAANPQGRFYAADFNPGHVASAAQLATAGGLDNLTLLENSFAELAEGEVAGLPQFDFITLHGIYTWVTAENRAHIVKFIGRYLKPGGIVYASYNAMPGLCNHLPMQRLLVEHAGLFPNRSDVQIKNAISFVEQMDKAGAAYLTINGPVISQRRDMLKKGDVHYLVHEYMHRHWQPLYHADVARDFSAAKLDYVGSAELHLAYPSLYRSPEQQALLDGIADPILRETVSDYMRNTLFRRDVFVRGARRMSLPRQQDWLAQTGVALLVPRDQVNLKMSLSTGEVEGKADIYLPVLDALAQGPRTMAELASLPELKSLGMTNLVQVAAMLTVSHQANVYFAGAAAASPDSVRRLNRALCAHCRLQDEYHAMASALLGNGSPAAFVEKMMYLALAEQPDQEIQAPVIVRQLWQLLVSQGRRLSGADGRSLESEQENLQELEKQLQFVLDFKLPLWRQLKML